MKLIWVILLYMALFQIKIIKMEEMIGLPGDENECDCVKKNVAEANKNTKILSPYSIIGKWVSGECESRSGPKFMLRSYTFFTNQTFQLMQFYYDDESCTTVSYTVALVGRYTVYKLKRRSSPSSAAHIESALHKASIIAHDHTVATKIVRTLGKKCSGLTKPHWKPYEEYVLFNTNDNKFGVSNTTDENDSSAEQKRYTRDVKHDGCLAAIDLSLDELNTVRIQSHYSNKDGFKYELLLANTYYTDQQVTTLRHKFQLPLVLVNGTTDCHICNEVARSTNMFVVGLLAKVKLPLHVNGKWISERCEPLSTGLFSMRVLQLLQQPRTWLQQTFYYADYACSNLTMEHRAFGSFNTGAAAKKMPGAVDVNFFIEKSFLTVFEEHALEDIRSDRLCGVSHSWQLNETNEIPPETGCTSVGIVYQQKNFDIARLDVDEHGTYWLYLGDEDSTSSISRRPMAFKYPLLRCSRYVDDELLFQTDSADSIFVLPTYPRALTIVSVIYVLLATR